MSEQATQPFWMGAEFWTVLIVVVGVVAVAFIFRGSKLKGMKVKAGGINAEMHTHEPPMQEIKGNTLKGKGNAIRTERGDTNIRDNTLDGENQKIDVKNSKK
jgi:hypothetical protein